MKPYRTIVVQMLACFVGVLALSGCATTRAPLPTVADLDLDRFMGLWYEIAHYDVWYQRGMTGITDTYRRRPDGGVYVLTEYGTEKKPLERKALHGEARIPDPAEPGRWRLMFYWPFEADFCVIDVDRADYAWAVIGQPSRDGLWILARTPTLADETFDDICAGLAAFGYDATKLLASEHPQLEVGDDGPPPPRGR